MNDALFDYWKEMNVTADSHAEYSLFCYPVSDCLLERNACIFHAVSFVYRHHAYLITGLSGIGKSTHYMYLRKYYDQIRMISGDRLVLSVENDSVIVYPTPWNGKENLYSDISEKLGGIIYLNRGEHSTICSMNKREAVIPLFSQIFQSQTKDSIQLAASFLEQILNRIPVWHLTSGKPDESSKLLYEMLKERESYYEL